MKVNYQVILGKELADNLDVKVGNVITLMTFNSDYKMLVYDITNYICCWDNNTGLSEFDKKQVFVIFKMELNYLVMIIGQAV